MLQLKADAATAASNPQSAAAARQTVLAQQKIQQQAQMLQQMQQGQSRMSKELPRMGPAGGVGAGGNAAAAGGVGGVGTSPPTSPTGMAAGLWSPTKQRSPQISPQISEELPSLPAAFAGDAPRYGRRSLEVGAADEWTEAGADFASGWFIRGQVDGLIIPNGLSALCSDGVTMIPRSSKRPACDPAGSPC